MQGPLIKGYSRFIFFLNLNTTMDKNSNEEIQKKYNLRFNSAPKALKLGPK